MHSVFMISAPALLFLGIIISGQYFTTASIQPHAYVSVSLQHFQNCAIKLNYCNAPISNSVY